MPTHHLLAGFTLGCSCDRPGSSEQGIAENARSGCRVVVADVDLLMCDALVETCRAHSLLFVVECCAQTAEDAVPALRRAKRLGALCVSVHAGAATMTAGEAGELADALLDVAGRERVRLLFRTCRGCIMQDLGRASELCERVPRLRVALDPAHYVADAGLPAPTRALLPWIGSVMDRAEMLFAGIPMETHAFAEAGAGASELAQRYVAFWSETMRRWRLRSKPGSMLVFAQEHEPSEGSTPAMAREAWARSADTATVLW